MSLCLFVSYCLSLRALSFVAFVAPLGSVPFFFFLLLLLLLIFFGTSNVDLRETSASVECVYMQDDINLYLSDSLYVSFFFLNSSRFFGCGTLLHIFLGICGCGTLQCTLFKRVTIITISVSKIQN